MKKIYLIYISLGEDIFSSFKYLIPNTRDFTWSDDKFYGLYAWTTDKELLDEFMETREKKIYTVTKKEIYKDEFKALKEHLYLLQLNRYNYNSSKEKDKKELIEVVSTKNEYIEVTENGIENFYEFGPDTDGIADYRMFNDDLIQALDIIGYTTEYDIAHGDEYQSDSANYQKSYNLNVFGNEIVTDTSELVLLIYLFYYAFYGYKRRNSI